MAIDTITFRNTPYTKQFIFGGVAFDAIHKFISIPAGTSKYIELRTGTPKIHHETQRIVTPSGPLEVYLYENPTITTPGTIAIATQNINRNSLKTSQTTFFNNPVGISGGILLEQLYFPVGTGVNVAPSSSLPLGTERIYKLNTTYIVEFKNIHNAVINVFYTSSFYESDN